MTMILGFNLEDVSYMSGDTRVTRPYGISEDNVQKIEIVKEHGLFVAAAGSAVLASEFVSAMKSGKVSIPVHKQHLLEETESIIDSYLTKIDSLEWQPIDPLKPVVLLLQHVADTKVHMAAYHFTFVEDNSRVTRIRESIVGPNEYVMIGAIGKRTPVYVDAIPSSSLPILRSPLSGSIPFEAYLAVTDAIFETARSRGAISIGGKTTTLVTYKVDGNKYSYRGIRGYKSVIHSDGDYQDVSMYTDLDVESGNFFIRDMRKDGRIVTNIECIDGNYRFLYDSCPPDSGEDYVYYKGFSAFAVRVGMDPKIMDLEL